MKHISGTRQEGDVEKTHRSKQGGRGTRAAFPLLLRKGAELVGSSVVPTALAVPCESAGLRPIMCCSDLTDDILLHSCSIP